MLSPERKIDPLEPTTSRKRAKRLRHSESNLVYKHPSASVFSTPLAAIITLIKSRGGFEFLVRIMIMGLIRPR